MSDATQKKSKIPYFFFVFFAVVVSVNVFYIYLSNKSWRGVVTENAYQKGLKYNETIDESEKQRQLGWKVDIKQRRIDEKNAEILIEVRNKHSVKISTAAVEILFKRPAQDGFDFKVKAIASNARNVYVAKVNFPFPGQWDAEILIKKDEDSFVLKQRFMLQ